MRLSLLVAAGINIGLLVQGYAYAEADLQTDAPTDTRADAPADSQANTQANTPAGPAVASEAQQAQAQAQVQDQALATALDVIPVPEHPAAEPAPAPPPARRVGMAIEEIVVTAQKREQAVNDVPIAISAFSGDDLKALGVTDTRDLGNLVPGLSVNDSGGGTPIYTLRGVGFSDTTYTATGNVGLYLDGISLPYSVMSRGPSVDIERVEVLKGPQGTLYGRNTTGGLINQIARKPSDTLESGVTAGYSRFDTEDVEGFVSGPLTDDIKGRLAARYINSGDGWQYSHTRPDDTLGKQDKGSARGALEWTPRDDLSLRASVDYWFDKGEPTAPQAIAFIPQNPFIGAMAFSPAVSNYPLVPMKGADPREADWEPNEDWKLNDSFLMGALKGTWNINDTLDLNAIYSHIRQRSDGSSQIQSGLNVFNVESPATDAYVDSDNLELRLSGLWGDSFRYMIGTNLSKDSGGEVHHLRVDTISAFYLVVPTTLTQGNGQLLPLIPYLPFLPPGPYLLNGQNVVANKLDTLGFVDIDQYAVFLNTDWAFIDNFNLNTAVRYTINNQHFLGCGKERADSEGVGLSNVFTGLSALAAAEYLANTGMLGTISVVHPTECWVPSETGSTKAFEDDLDEHNLSGRIALDWKPDDATLFYASVSRGFKAGGFPVLNPANQAQFVPVKQEELLAFEAGIKASTFERRLQSNLTTYFYNYKNKQLYTKTPDPVFGALPILKNAPKSHVYGVELDVQAAPINGLFIALAASWLKTEIDEFSSTDSEGDVRDFKGRPFNFAPDKQVNLNLDYTWAISNALDFGVGGDVNYTGATNGMLDGNPKFAMEDYHLFGARVHVGSNDKQWTLTGWGRNLTNEFYTAAVFNVGDAVGRFAGRPRTYGLSINYNFAQ